MRVPNTIRKLTALLGALALIAAPCAPQSGSNSPAPAQEKPAKPNSARAKKEMEAGKKAEKSADWETAYAEYAEALNDAPGNKEAELLRDSARFRLVQQHMDGAERELLAGNNPGAQTELLAAIALDPSSKIARERLAQVVSMDPPKQLAAAKDRKLAPPVKLKFTPGAHTFDVRGDTQSVFTAVAQQFGIIAQFDSDLPPGRTVHFKVPNLDFETAMNVLAVQTHTFWAAYDETRVIIADDSPAKRKQFEPLEVRTFVLPASVSDEDMTNTLRVVREIVGITRTSLNVASREITVRDTPKNVAIAEELIDQIEQGRGELVLEVELLEVDKNAARDLGIHPSTTAQIVPLTKSDITQLENATSTQALTALIQSIFGTSGGGLGGLLPPLVAFGGGSTIFFSTLANAQANFSQTYGTVHSAQRLLLRAQDGKPATFFLGEHFPITLSLLSANLGNTVPGVPTLNNLPTGNGPSAVVSASLRANGLVDLIVANATDGTIDVYLGNGDGTFVQQPPIKVGTTPVALVAQDFNGDGHVDVAVVNQGDNTVSVLFGDGTGAFPGSTTFPTNEILQTGKTPSAIVAADFNSDGHFDLAVTNFGDDTVSVYLNDATGTGTFTPVATTVPTGKGPIALATTDFNADGIPDLAVVNQTDNTVSVFLGQNGGTGPGNGTFLEQAPSPYATDLSPFGITISDLNGDGVQDIAVTNQNSGTVSVFLGNGAGINTGPGTFQPKLDSPTGNGPTAVVSGAFAAGTLDLIVANFADNTISVLAPNTSATTGALDGTFSNAFTIATGTGPIAMASADFNGDSAPDLAVADQTGNVISIILNSATLATNNPTTQTPYPGSQYEDIGFKVKATPRLHAGSEVTLQLSFDISSLAGSNINGIPIITHRQVDQTVRVRENEPSVLAGLLDTQEMRTITGWPGANQLGAAGYLDADHTKNSTGDEFIIVITPRLVHSIPHSGKPIYAGRDTTRSGPGQPQ